MIQLGYVGPIEKPDDLQGLSPAFPNDLLHFRPSKSISIGAMAVHHIIDQDLIDCEPWPGGWSMPMDLLEDLGYLIGHNVDFDWKNIGAPNLRRICTLALARHLLPDLDSHNLSALVYHFSDDRLASREMLRAAHNARGDCWMVSLILPHLLRAMREFGAEVETWEQVWQFSEVARVPTRFWFGKYGPQNGKLGEYIATVALNDRRYLTWCLNNPDKVTMDEYQRRGIEQCL